MKRLNGKAYETDCLTFHSNRVSNQTRDYTGLLLSYVLESTKTTPATFPDSYIIIAFITSVFKEKSLFAGSLHHFLGDFPELLVGLKPQLMPVYRIYVVDHLDDFLVPDIFTRLHH